MNMNEARHFTADNLRRTLRHNVDMRRHTSWRAGGSAERVYQPADLADLAAFLRMLPAQEPLLAVGLGSNLLVRDGGLRGTVLLMHAVRVAGQGEAVFVEKIQDMPQAILNMAQANDVVLTMGAGSIGGVPAMVRNMASGKK